MRERPILFSGPMVRALLAGTKTQTRRIVKPQPAGAWAAPGKTSCPYGQPGDRLWVREAFRFAASLDRLSPNDVGEKALDAGYNTPWAPTQFEADGRRAGAWHGFDTPPTVTKPGKLRPGIHMPRWACRLVLEITGVRVERLQEISEADAKAEGCAPAWLDADDNATVRAHVAPTYRQGFARLWRDINGAASWQANPWVWVVEFRAQAHPDHKDGGANAG